MWSSTSLPVLLFVGFVTLLGALAGQLRLQPAMSRARIRRSISRPRASSALAILMESTRPDADSTPTDSNRPGGLGGFLARGERPLWMRAGLGNRPPAPPEVGRQAQVRWWERVRALVGLALVILSLAVFLLASLGVLGLIASYLLEQLV